MAESTSGNGNKDVGRVPSFSKFLRGPLSPKRIYTKQKGRSSSALSRLNPVKIFGRKKSGIEDDELTIDPGLVETIEEVAKVMEMTTYETTLHLKDEDNLKFSTETEKKDMNWGAKVMQQVHSLEDGVKEGLEKAKENVVTTLDELISGVSKNNSQEEHQHEQQKEITENKFLNEAQATPTQISEPVSEHVIINHVDMTQSSSKSKERNSNDKKEEEEKKEEKENHMDTTKSSSSKQKERTSNDEKKAEEKMKEEKEKEKEDDCVSFLAQGIQKLCILWSTKKED